MADSDEADYLSDKFLAEASPSAPKTYHERRKEAQRLSQLKNEKNKKKSRLQREVEAREEGLRKSLFARAKEEEEAGLGSGNKALSIMMKMGFKPGEALGKGDDPNVPPVMANPPETVSSTKEDGSEQPKAKSLHKADPLPILEWGGKVGIGLRKRPPSPTSEERLAKAAKVQEQTTQQTFRDRTRQEYEERRAEGRLMSAQRTCRTLDETAGKLFNVLSLDPYNNESFPDGFLDALNEHSTVALVPYSPDHNDAHDNGIQSRLRRQMQADALQPLSLETEDALPSGPSGTLHNYSSETLDEASQFLRLNARDRLPVLLNYLRRTYSYCFWCGTQYGSQSEMEESCPGEDEDAHD